MSDQLPQLNDLTPYLQKVEFIRQTAAQIQKDFGEIGAEIQFSGQPETAYRELHEQIAPLLSQLNQHNFERFQFLLYRIDISEQQVRNAQSIEEIADLVIHRELKKVLLRHWFKSQSNDSNSLLND